MLPFRHFRLRPRRRFVTVLLLAVTAYVLLPQVSLVGRSLDLIRSADPWAIVASIVCTAITFPLAAITYHCLARRRLIYRRTLLVTIANMFTNRLLPAGAGSIATFYVYLRKRRHTVSQATSVVAVNNILGVVSHSLLLLSLFLINPRGFNGFHRPAVDVRLTIGIVLVIVVVVFVIAVVPNWRTKLYTMVRTVGTDLLFYRHFPRRLTGALVTSTLLTVANAVALGYCVAAVGGHVGFVAALTIFTIGIIAGTLTPTPGGLGGTEAGLLAALVAYHLPAQKALAAVIVYRLISYWLTLALGAAVYAYIEQRGYLHRFEPSD